MSQPIRIAPRNASRPKITPATMAANPERLHARHIAYEVSTAIPPAASSTLIAVSISPESYCRGGRRAIAASRPDALPPVMRGDMSAVTVSAVGRSVGVSGGALAAV
jgi:hypothetical protein